MKKFAMIALAGVLVFLAGCGNGYDMPPDETCDAPDWMIFELEQAVGAQRIAGVLTNASHEYTLAVNSHHVLERWEDCQWRFVHTRMSSFDESMDPMIWLEPGEHHHIAYYDRQTAPPNVRVTGEPLAPGIYRVVVQARAWGPSEDPGEEKPYPQGSIWDGQVSAMFVIE